jgi:hypothetical protein
VAVVVEVRLVVGKYMLLRAIKTLVHAASHIDHSVMLADDTGQSSDWTV